MKSTRLAFATCVAWAGVALSTVAPAEATVVTSQYGTFAACSNNYTVQLTHVLCNPDDTPEDMPYQQTIKFQGVPCNSGDCGPPDLSVKSDTVYTPGRQ